MSSSKTSPIEARGVYLILTAVEWKSERQLEPKESFGCHVVRVSSQVDQVAGSMLETEKTMNDLQFATGLAPIDEEVPELVQMPPVQ